MTPDNKYIVVLEVTATKDVTARDHLKNRELMQKALNSAFAELENGAPRVEIVQIAVLKQQPVKLRKG